MKIKNSKFHKSFYEASKIDNKTVPEIALVGRSNVGKSTLLNYLTNSKLAKVSSVPGKTRLINYFSINDNDFYLVDLPGYGYAKRSKDEQDKWGKELEIYFKENKRLKHVFLLVDSRIKPMQSDIDMAIYLNYYNISYTILMTKCDKLSRSELSRQKMEIAKTFKLGVENIILVSANAKFGLDDICSRIEQFI